MNEKLIKRIKTNKLFENIEITKLNFEKINGKLLTFSSGQMIFTEGDPSEYVYLILSGQVSVMRNALLGGPEHLSFEKDDFFGMEEIAEGTNRICTAVATEDTYVIGLTKEEIQKLIDQEVQIQENIFKYSGLSKPEKSEAEITEEKEVENESGEKTEETDSAANEDIEKNRDHDIQSTMDSSTAAVEEEEKGDNIANVEPMPSFEETDEEFADQYMNPLDALDDSIAPPIEEESISEVIAANDTENILTPPDIEPDIPETVPEETTDEIISPPGIIDDTESVDNNSAEFTRDELLESMMPLIEEEIKPTENDFKDAPQIQEPEEFPAENIAEEDVPPILPIVEEAQSEKEKEPKSDALVGLFNSLISAENLVDLTFSFEEETAKILSVERCFVFFVSENKVLEVLVKKEEGVKKYRQKLGEGTIGLSAQVGEPVVVQDAKRDQRVYADVVTQIVGDIKNLVAVPLELEKESFVVCAINDSESISSDKVSLINRLFESYIAARNKLLTVQKNASKERKVYSRLLLNFLSKNVKTKTTLIKNYANHLLGKELGGEEKSLAKLIRESAQEITEKMLFVSVVDWEDTPYRFVDISLKQQLEEFIKKHESFFEEQYCTVIAKMEDDAIVKIDPVYFQRAVWEIAKNSIESMPFGGNIIFKTEIDNNKIKVIIADNGKGIDDEKLDLIFEPFVAFGKEDHSGLGLAFVKAVIKAFGGKVSAKKGSEKGMTFTLEFPLVIV